MSTEKVWLVTGGNKGIGAAIVKEALSNGNKVVATSRSIEAAEKNLGGHENLFIVKMDITDNAQIRAGIDAAIEKFGTIDVLVNNAGYGLLGIFEEMSEESIRKQLDTNVIGTMEVTRAVLPTMRKQGSGLVVSISSTSGIKSVPGGSVYSASKFAIEGWMEGMKYDLKSFGVDFMILEPGAYRTDFANEQASMKLPDMDIAAYKEIRDGYEAKFKEMNGNQGGDPSKLAKGLYKVASSEEIPTRLLISKPAIEQIETYYKNRFAEFEKYKEVSAYSEFEN